MIQILSKSCIADPPHSCRYRISFGLCTEGLPVSDPRRLDLPPSLLQVLEYEVQVADSHAVQMYHYLAGQNEHGEGGNATGLRSGDSEDTVSISSIFPVVFTKLVRTEAA